MTFIPRRLLPGVLVTTMLVAPTAAQQPLMAKDLVLPRGISASGDGVLISEQGSGRIVRLGADGAVSVVVDGITSGPYVDPTGETVTAGAAYAIDTPDGGIAFLTNGPECFCFWLKPADGEPKLVADLGLYEKEHNTDGDMLPDGSGPELDSNPYALAIDPAGGFFISDAAANAILRVTEDGTITPYAVFADRPNPLVGKVGGPTMQTVPTAIAVGPDGALYVGSLTGFPFPPGGAEIYRLADGDNDGDAVDAGEVEVFATGLTGIVSMAFDKDGSLLVGEFSTNQLAQEPGRIVRVRNGAIEPVAAPLVSPTGLAVIADGRILVTMEFMGMVTEAATAAEIVRSAPKPQ